MLRIKKKRKFDIQLENLITNNIGLQSTIDQRIRWFARNPKDTRLENHALRRKMVGKCAFNITDDIRIVYVWVGKNTVRFLAIGSHKEVYKK